MSMIGVQVERRDGYFFIRVNERYLDKKNAETLQVELKDLNYRGVKNVLIEISEVEFIDSSGLAAILIGHRLCSELNGRLIVAGVQKSPMELIKVSKLDNMLQIVDSVEEGADLLKD